MTPVIGRQIFGRELFFQVMDVSQAVAGLIRRGLGSGSTGEIGTSARTGFPVAHLGRTITSEDVRRLEDDDQ